IPKTVDDYLQSKEAFRGTELPRGVLRKRHTGKGEKEDSGIMAHRRQSATPLERSLGSRGRSGGISGLKDTHKRGGLSQDHVRALFQHATSINSIKGSSFYHSWDDEISNPLESSNGGILNSGGVGMQK
nr:hypothetical protein [Tanacetum cinerariifolium]